MLGLTALSLVEGAIGTSNEVNANEVLAEIKTNQPTEFDNCIIVGDLDLSALKIVGPVHFSNTLFRNSVSFAFTTFKSDADFFGSTFNGPADFSATKFNGPADFGSKFNGDASFLGSTFNGPASFLGSTFNGPAYSTADFRVSTFNDTADFGGAKFNDPADFLGSTFNGPAYFRGSTFNDTAYFRGSTFNGPADFSATKFNDPADFSNSQLNNTTDFEETTFQKEIKFNDAKFRGNTSFLNSQFKEDALFEGANFNCILNLTRTKYANLYIRWRDIKNLAYDDAAYLSLMENFKKLGYIEDYDNCYFEYRKEHRSQNWSGGFHGMSPIEERIRKVFDIGLEVSYGYGKRPLNPLGWSIFFIGLFSLIWMMAGVDAPLRFSFKAFLSGTRLFIDPPKIPEQTRLSRSLLEDILSVERALGALFSVLFFLAIGATIVR